MAEAVGLALGVVGLAGIIGAFKDTIDLFSLIADARHLGRDYEILDTKFDIEKTLLLQWADRVKLLKPDYDKRLDDAHVQTLVARILSLIRLLLSDTNDLQQRYGLSPEEGSGLRVIQQSDILRISQKRINTFIQQFKDIRLRIDLRGQSASFHQKARWVIRDKQKFECLIQELTHLTMKLNEILPVTDGFSSGRSMVTQDLAMIKDDLRRLKVVLESSAGNHGAIAESSQHLIDKTCQDRILDTLWFRKIDDRRESIAEAHAETFHLALEDSDHGVPWDSLSTWLRLSSGVYWVFGKAGSGKSTLIKFLYNHERTEYFLSLWANGNSCLLCDFFFWDLGSDEQKTLEGLSRTLLYQVLSWNRSLIRPSLPNMWKEVYDTAPALPKESFDTAKHLDLPSPAETRYAFEVIAKSSSQLARLCFFIDGLDEFHGDYMDGIAFIKSLAVNEHIKIVVSSRPISACVAAFSTFPQLRLQDLTRADIHSYVQDVIGRHALMKKHIRQLPQHGAKILNDLVEKSSGVFLWVILACRSILNGLADHDRIHELQHRVDELPSELEDMFAHMLSKVPRRHRAHGARLLQICHTKQQVRSLPFPPRDLFALGLALVDDYHLNSVCIKARTPEDQAELCEELEGRLRSRCDGLLEFTVENHRHPDEFNCLCGSALGTIEKGINIFIDSKVVFMHRTVFEFLSNDYVWDLECLKPHDDGFSVATSLSFYSIHVAMAMLHLQHETRAMLHFEEALWWAVQSDKQGRLDDPWNLFGHLTPFLSALSEHELAEPTLQRLSKTFVSGGTHQCHPTNLLLAIEAGAVNFVKRHPYVKLMTKHNRALYCCMPILYHALRPQFVSQRFTPKEWQKNWLSSEMARLLLSNGCNPNDCLKFKRFSDVGSRNGRDIWWYSLTTPWYTWLDDLNYTLCHTGRTTRGEEYDLELLSITRAFLTAGAEAQAASFSLESGIQSFIDNGDSYRVIDEASQILGLIRSIKRTCHRV